MSNHSVHCGDALAVLMTLPDESVNCCVTSPPYWGLRDYGVDGQIGLETTPQEFVARLVAVFAEVRRVLRSDGTLWLNLGDSYTGSGKGGNPDSGKQATNKGSQTVGTLYGKTAESTRIAAVTNVGRLCSEQGYAPKNLVGIPWRVAFALQESGWYLRQDIIWAKPNPMPESVRDRCTKAHEYVFLLSKSPRYYYDAEAIMEDSVTDDPRRPYGSPGANALDARNAQGRGQNRKRGEFNGKTEALAADGRNAFRCFTEVRNRRSVWTVPTRPYPEAHFATFPPELIEPMILAGCPAGGAVLDPFAGSGTTLEVATRLGRKAVGIELNPEYVKLIHKRLQQGYLPLEASL